MVVKLSQNVFLSIVKQISGVMSDPWDPFLDQKVKTTWSITSQIILHVSPTAQFHNQTHPLASLLDIRVEVLLQELGL